MVCIRLLINFFFVENMFQLHVHVYFMKDLRAIDDCRRQFLKRYIEVVLLSH